MQTHVYFSAVMALGATTSLCYNPTKLHYCDINK